MLDAPVSGSISLVEQGKLSIMVGGHRGRLRQPPSRLLEDIGQKVTYIGENGLALSMKLATNISIAVQMLAFAEGLLLADARRYRAVTLAAGVMTQSPIGSPMLQSTGTAGS